MELSKIVESLVLEQEAKQQIAALDQAMADSFKLMGVSLEKNKETLQQDVQQAHIDVNESLTTLTVVGMLLAAPKVLELIVSSVSRVTKLFKRIFTRNSAATPEQQVELAKHILEFTHKWHKLYIKGLRWVLKTSGLLDKVGIKGDTAQLKAAELIYYTIIASLAVYSGVSSVSAFKQAATTTDLGHFSLGAMEAAMASIKTGEVVSFVSKLGLKT